MLVAAIAKTARKETSEVRDLKVQVKHRFVPTLKSTFRNILCIAWRMTTETGV